MKMNGAKGLHCSLIVVALSLQHCSRDTLGQVQPNEYSAPIERHLRCVDDGTREGLLVDSGECVPDADALHGWGRLCVPLNDVGAVAVIDTRNRTEIARLRTGTQPRRCVIDRDGNVVATGQWVHRFNYDCVPGELPPNVSDDCVDLVVDVGAVPKAIAVDFANNIWVGTKTLNAAGNNAFKIDGVTGEVTQQFVIESSYGMVNATNGNIWSLSTFSGSLQEIDVERAEVIREVPLGDGPFYGLAAGRDGKVYFADGGCIGSYDPETEEVTTPFCPVHGEGWVRGVAAGQFVYAADYDLHRILVFDLDGTPLGEIPAVDPGPMGIGLDRLGRLWVPAEEGRAVSTYTHAYHQFAGRVLLDAKPYGYADMTGFQLSQLIQPTSFWRVNVNATPTAQWRMITMDADIPEHTEIELNVYAARDQQGELALIGRDVTLPFSLGDVPEDYRFLQIEVTLHAYLNQDDVIVMPRLRTIVVHEQ